MTLHESMHAYASYWLGDYTAKIQGRLSLNPVKHIDPFMTILLPILLAVSGAPIFGGAKPVPINPYALRWGEWGMALVALAGPVTNLIIAFLTYGAWVMLDTPSGDYFTQVVYLTVIVNLGFFIFNMIPIPPLDGSRVIYALAPDFVRRFMDVIEQYGVFVVFALVLLFGPYFNVFISDMVNIIIEIFNNIYIF